MTFEAKNVLNRLLGQGCNKLNVHQNVCPLQLGSKSKLYNQHITQQMIQTHNYVKQICSKADS
ncbi:hypothetical protein Hanom_Chr16g01437011 [Helianthus anomalus]